VTLQAVTNDTDPSPTVTFSTNKPLLLSLSPSGGPYACAPYVCANVVITAIAPSFVTAQSPPADYNITVTATWDDLVSNDVQVFNNIPYYNYVVNEGQYCSSPGVCNCNSSNFYPGQGRTGYVTLIDVYARDLFGNTLVQIPANETLKDQLYLGSGGWTSALGNPKPGAWPITAWNSDISFPDYYFVCSPNPSSFTPPPTSYGTGGVIAVFTETQNYWSGSAANGSGVCTRVNYVQLYTDHGVQGGAEILLERVSAAQAISLTQYLHFNPEKTMTKYYLRILAPLFSLCLPAAHGANVAQIASGCDVVLLGTVTSWNQTAANVSFNVFVQRVLKGTRAAQRLACLTLGTCTRAASTMARRR